MHVPCYGCVHVRVSMSTRACVCVCVRACVCVCKNGQASPLPASLATLSLRTTQRHLANQVRGAGGEHGLYHRILKPG